MSWNGVYGCSGEGRERLREQERMVRHKLLYEEKGDWVRTESKYGLGGDKTGLEIGIFGFNSWLCHCLVW